MKDAQLKNEFKTLITNLREHGVLFYRDSAGKAAARAANEPPRCTAPADRNQTIEMLACAKTTPLQFVICSL